MRLIDANELKQRILVERDKIPFTLPSATYEFGIAKPNHHGNSMRSGIRKALRCMEQCKTVDAVEVVRCRDCKHFHTETVEEQTPYGFTNDKKVCGCMLRGEWVDVFIDDFCSYGERKGK